MNINETNLTDWAKLFVRHWQDTEDRMGVIPTHRTNPETIIKFAKDIHRDWCDFDQDDFFERWDYGLKHHQTKSDYPQFNWQILMAWVRYDKKKDQRGMTPEQEQEIRCHMNKIYSELEKNKPNSIPGNIGGIGSRMKKEFGN